MLYCVADWDVDLGFREFNVLIEHYVQVEGVEFLLLVAGLVSIVAEFGGSGVGTGKGVVESLGIGRGRGGDLHGNILRDIT